MASYTMELSNYIEMWSQNNPTLSTKERIEIGRSKLFDFDYPIFDENYKHVFETNFIRNFYMREIGFETEGLFKFRLETWLNINMPYFNKLFESELIKFDPLINEKMDINYQKKNDGTNSNNRTFTKTDTKDINTTNNKDTIQNDITNKGQTNNKDLDNTQIGKLTTDDLINEKTDSKVTNKATGETSGNSTGKATVKGKNGETGFSRDLESNTPDSRLAITSNDGKGVIEYASRIDEKTVKNDKTNESTTDTTDISKTNSKNDSNTQDLTSVDTKLNRKTSTENTTKETVKDTMDMNEDYKSDKNENERGNLNERFNSNITDGNKGTITGIEDYIQHKIGKTGSITQSEMLYEFRKTFLRLEKEIFYEMNELFMLVY